MKFNKNFIGHEKPNTSRLVDGIEYKYNKFGHRCKDVEDIDLENYILFAGCSHTEGEGLHVHESYPYITAKELNADYYNLGIRASGFDVVFYNLMCWLNTYPNPKLIVLQYPDPSRFSIASEGFTFIEPIGPWCDIGHNIGLFLNADKSGMSWFRNYCNNKLLNQYIKTSLIKIIFGSVKPYDSETIRINKLDLATDNLHYGFETHTNCSEIIVDSYYAKINT